MDLASCGVGRAIETVALPSPPFLSAAAFAAPLQLRNRLSQTEPPFAFPGSHPTDARLLPCFAGWVCVHWMGGWVWWGKGRTGRRRRNSLWCAARNVLRAYSTLSVLLGIHTHCSSPQNAISR